MLAKDIEQFMLNKKHNYNVINTDAPYIHKLTEIGKHLNEKNTNSLYKYIKPITQGYNVEIKYTNNTIKTDIIKIEHIKKSRQITLQNKDNEPVNNYIISYDRLIEYTLGIFCKNFDYHINYRTDKYNNNVPKVMLTGSMIGEYCLSNIIDRNHFIKSDIDIGVVDSYLIYAVKQNIILNLRLLNDFNVNFYKDFIKSILLNMFKTINVLNLGNTKLIDNVMSYILNAKSKITYDIVFPNNYAKTVYKNIHYEKLHTHLLDNIYIKYDIVDNKIKKIISSYLFQNYDYVQNMKICINNIFYYDQNYVLTKYKDIDLYISSLTKICLYHETIVRSCYSDGEFYMFTDCLNSIITRTSIDYRAYLGKKSPIEIMLTKHKQCITNRILSNQKKIIDFIIGVVLSAEITLSDKITSDIIASVKKITNVMSMYINIGEQYIIKIIMTQLI